MRTVNSGVCPDLAGTGSSAWTDVDWVTAGWTVWAVKRATHVVGLHPTATSTPPCSMIAGKTGCVDTEYTTPLPPKSP